MTKEQLIIEAGLYTARTDSNYVHTEDAAQYGLTGPKLFDEPLVGFADAADPLFVQLREKGAIGPHFMTPEQWLPGAKTVISIFLPFTEAVRASNRAKDAVPSPAWLYGRVEGQVFVNDMSLHIVGLLAAAGHQATSPCLDPRFHAVTAPDSSLGKEWEGVAFSSNWSERHVAYVCGLGTFGLSKGLITEKGMAGRICSVVTNAVFQPTQRPYTDLYAYCTGCGACTARCPAEAITLESGKDHMKCGPFVGRTKALYAPRYGCGKCQVQVPCESRNPTRK